MKKFWNRFDSVYLKKSKYAIFTVVAIAVILFALYSALPGLSTMWKLLGAVLKPLIIGCVFSYLLAPIVSWIEKKLLKAKEGQKWKRSVAVLLTILLIVSVIAAFSAVLVWTATKQITQIDYESIKNFYEEIQNSIGDFSEQIEEMLAKSNFSVSSVTKNMTAVMSGVMSGIAGFMSSLFFGLIFAIYFLIDGEHISRYWKDVAKKLLPKDTIRLMKELGADADLCFSGYIRGQSLDAIIVGALTSIVFLIIGMPYAVLIGIVTGFGNLIPYIGPILGFGTIVLVNLFSLNIRMMVIGVVVLLIIMFVDSNIINPKLLANNVHVHPLMVVAALLAGGAIGGVVGMLLAVPVGAFIKMQFDKFLNRRASTEVRRTS